MKIQEQAPAKIHLALNILGRRTDGYHELRMVMQTVSLHDDVTVTLTDSKGITCRVDGAALPCDERNLAVKSAKVFCEAMDYGGGIDIGLIKRIPSEAGMAGGSADAAAVLRALREPSPPPSRMSGSSRSARRSAATFPSAWWAARPWWKAGESA